MDVNFELTGNSNLLQHLKADPQNVAIDVGNHLQTSLVFSPKGICDLQDVKMRIKVREADFPQIKLSSLRKSQVLWQIILHAISSQPNDLLSAVLS